MPDYLPRTDNAFTAWLENFTTNAAANAGALGLAPADITAIQTLLATWQSQKDSAYAALVAYQSAIEAKQDARKPAVDKVRELVRRIQSNPDVPDELRAGLKITIKDRTRTRPTRPENAPSLLVDFGTRHWHIVHWGHSPMRERSNGKPKGVFACEIRYFIGEPPPNTDAEEFPLVAIATKSPLIMKHEHNIGATIAYAGRYLNTRMEPGDWSERRVAIVGR